MDQEETKKADLNGLIEGIGNWQKQIYRTYRDNIQSQQDILSLRKELAELKEVDKLKALEIQENNSRISELHQILSKRVTLEDENIKLRKENHDIREEMKIMEQSHKLEQKAALDQVDEVREVLRAEFENAIEEIKESAKTEQDALKKDLSEKSMMVNQLELQLQQGDKEKQAEIMKIRFEYDTKMLKLQRENARKQQTPPTNLISQDIFRKKLQHVKAESEREADNLRKKIAELERALAERTAPKPGPAPGNMLKRIRRF